jgi:hypothetical protein
MKRLIAIAAAVAFIATACEEKVNYGWDFPDTEYGEHELGISFPYGHPNEGLYIAGNNHFITGMDFSGNGSVALETQRGVTDNVEDPKPDDKAGKEYTVGNYSMGSSSNATDGKKRTIDGVGSVEVVPTKAASNDVMIKFTPLKGDAQLIAGRIVPQKKTKLLDDIARTWAITRVDISVKDGDNPEVGSSFDSFDPFVIQQDFAKKGIQFSINQSKVFYPDFVTITKAGTLMLYDSTSYTNDGILNSCMVADWSESKLNSGILSFKWKEGSEYKEYMFDGDAAYEFDPETDFLTLKTKGKVNGRQSKTYDVTVALVLSYPYSSPTPGRR